MNRRRALQRTAAAISAATTVSSRSLAQQAPAKTMRLIVSSAPGTPPDIVGRLIADRLLTVVSEPLIVENKPGAIGTMGLRLVARAEPDGPGHWHVLDAVSGRAEPACEHAVRQSHIGSALLTRAAGIEAVHVPYQGASSVVAIMSGQVDMYLGPAATLAALIESGKLRVLATAAPQRVAAYPGAPTLVELGYSRVELTDWLGVVAPFATPSSVVQKLAGVIGNASGDESVRRQFEGLGLAPVKMDRGTFTKFFHAECLRWNKLIREAGIGEPTHLSRSLRASRTPLFRRGCRPMAAPRGTGLVDSKRVTLAAVNPPVVSVGLWPGPARHVMSASGRCPAHCRHRACNVGCAWQSCRPAARGAPHRYGTGDKSAPVAHVCQRLDVRVST